MIADGCMSNRHTVHLTLGSSEWAALKSRAERESRSIANLILVLVRGGMTPDGTQKEAS